MLFPVSENVLLHHSEFSDLALLSAKIVIAQMPRTIFSFFVLCMFFAAVWFELWWGENCNTISV